MIKRGLIIGGYNTAARGWTLTKWQLAAATQKTSYVDKSGGDGSWDLSTTMTEGIPRYKDRNLSATFECSMWDRAGRETEIRRMVNQLDGLRLDIELPDDPDHYVIGRVHVKRDYNDLAHASVTVTATCEPWKYAHTEVEYIKAATTAEQSLVITNEGRRAVVPTLTVTGDGASIRLAYGPTSLALTAGTYQWPELLLTPGDHTLVYSGKGTLKITYREAVLE